MKLLYSTIVNGDVFSYPGRVATVIRIAGGPLRVKYLPAVDSQDPVHAEDLDFFFNLVSKQGEDDGETNAVVFAGVEPLSQGNAVTDICRRFRELGFFVKVESSGFYSSDLHVLSNTVNFVSLDLKHVLQQDKLDKLVQLKSPFDVFQSNVLKSLAFMEHCKAFREVKTTIIPGFNDDASIGEMAKLVKNACDQYALVQFMPAPLPLGDPAFEKILPPSRLQLLELGQVCRQHVGRVVVRCPDSEDQEVLPKAAATNSAENKE